MEEFAVHQHIPADQPGTRVLAITGSMTIHHGAEIKAALLEAIESADALQLDLAEVTAIDLIGLQFICSAHFSALAGHKRFSVMKSANPVVAAAAHEAGFDRHVGCVQDTENTCFWAGGGT
ncbi:MAG: STAS domain-containing protein [Desulfurivibrio sp.]|nr:MAG: STAS domain-containing protein [Desulfurivibrio sp.]